MRIPTTDSVYRMAGRGTGKRGRYEREICARYEPNEIEDIDMMRVKTSFVIPSTACDTEGRKSRRVESRMWNHISQPIAASIGGVGPGSEHVVLPTGECCEGPAETYSSLAGDCLIVRANAITSCQCNVNGRVASSGKRLAPQTANALELVRRTIQLWEPSAPGRIP